MSESQAIAWTAVIAFIGGFMVCAVVMLGASETEAVQHNCAEYNSTTGQFQWKDGEK